MISWMQHNKKYLVVTLWISAIAFIGAGFVGWGSYNYGNKASAIAKIGNVEIKLSELQSTYSNIYSYYSRMFGGKFDEDMAEKMKLQETAFDILKRDALLQNLAIDFGLTVLDKEVAEHIYNSKDFQEDGNFSREQYEFVLKNGGLTPKEYEERLRKVILITKLQNLLNIETTPFEEEVLGSLTKLEDNIEYKVLDSSDIEISLSEEDVKAHWELTKDKYMTREGYKISYVETPLSERDVNESELSEYFNLHALDYDGTFDEVKDLIKVDVLKNESKKNALKDYLAFKKDKFNGEIKSSDIIGFSELVPFEEMGKLSALNEGDFMKPIFSNGVFISIKLDKVIPAEVESFEAVKMAVETELEFTKKDEKLMELAKSSYKNFSGNETGFISLSHIGKDILAGLNLEEQSQFLNDVFMQSSNSGFLKIGSKIVLYKILEQRIGKSGDTLESDIVLQLKEQLLNENLIKRLEYYYPVETYFKG
jgi:peptidyl-prolyl cis-trans isomerase D